MAKIISTRESGITKEQMKILYQQNLIFCDDYELLIAIAPEWAMNEIESILGHKIEGVETEESRMPKNKMDMLLKNRYHYPRLYKSICG